VQRQFSAEPPPPAPQAEQSRAYLLVSIKRRHCIPAGGLGRLTVMGSGLGLKPTYTAWTLPPGAVGDEAAAALAAAVLAGLVGAVPGSIPLTLNAIKFDPGTIAAAASPLQSGSQLADASCQLRQ